MADDSDPYDIRHLPRSALMTKVRGIETTPTKRQLLLDCGQWASICCNIALGGEI